MASWEFDGRTDSCQCSKHLVRKMNRERGERMAVHMEQEGCTETQCACKDEGLSIEHTLYPSEINTGAHCCWRTKDHRCQEHRRKKGLSSTKSHHPQLGSEPTAERLQVCSNSGGHSRSQRGLRKEMKLIEMQVSFLATLNGWTESKDHFHPIPFFYLLEKSLDGTGLSSCYSVSLESPALLTLCYYGRPVWTPPQNDNHHFTNFMINDGNQS